MVQEKESQKITVYSEKGTLRKTGIKGWAGN